MINLETKVHFERLGKIKKAEGIKGMLHYDQFITRKRHPIYDWFCSAFTKQTPGKIRVVMRPTNTIEYNPDGTTSKIIRSLYD